jgi:hypothetical protein
MNVDWQTVLSTVVVGVGGTVAVSGAAAWLFKTAIREWIARETEAFKTQLRTDADIEIEKLRHSLQMTATEHDVKFARMHEKRAEMIEIVYARLTDLYWSAERFVITSENNPLPQKAEEVARLRETFFEVFSLVEQRRIFLSQYVCELLDRHLTAMRQTVIKAGVFGSIEHPTPRTADQIQTAFTEAYRAFERDIPAARKALEEEFRKIFAAQSL